MIKPIKQLLIKNLKLSNKESSLLPSSYQKIGDIVIINIKKELWKYDQKIGKIILENIPNTRVVCRRTDFITGQFRQPHVKVIAGDNNTETIHKEHHILYRLDVAKIMFAKGNLSERKRLSKLVKNGEIIVDMFAGIGYFSLGIAKFSNVERIYSIEKNPISYHYLCENIKLNKLENKIVPILGDCKKEAPKLGRIADRIIMGLLPSPIEYLSTALKIIKNKGIVHYHTTLGKEEHHRKVLEEIREIAGKEGFRVKLLKWKKVKSYAPKVDHAVLDLLFKKF